jgi:hypothetical protein
MKLILIVITLFFFIDSKGQAPKVENKINSVKTLNIYGNSKVIIGKLIINQTINKSLFLKSLTQVKDTNGIYNTTIIFDSPENPVVFGVKLKLEFDSPYLSMSEYNATTQGSMITTADDKKSWSLEATQLNIMQTFGGYTIVIQSLKPIKTTIYGIAGKIK